MLLIFIFTYICCYLFPLRLPIFTVVYFFNSYFFFKCYLFLMLPILIITYFFNSTHFVSVTLFLLLLPIFYAFTDFFVLFSPRLTTRRMDRYATRTYDWSNPPLSREGYWIAPHQRWQRQPIHGTKTHNGEPGITVINSSSYRGVPGWPRSEVLRDESG